MADYICPECGNQFEDGETVGVVERKPYHHILEEFSGEVMPIDCTMELVMNGESAVCISSRGVFYQGKIYDVSTLRNLPNAKEIKVVMNPAQTAHKLVGDLGALANQIASEF